MYKVQSLIESILWFFPPRYLETFCCSNIDFWYLLYERAIVFKSFAVQRGTVDLGPSNIQKALSKNRLNFSDQFRDMLMSFVLSEEGIIIVDLIQHPNNFNTDFPILLFDGLKNARPFNWYSFFCLIYLLLGFRR